jgi:hypothetical protein
MIRHRRTGGERRQQAEWRASAPLVKPRIFDGMAAWRRNPLKGRISEAVRLG